MPCLAANSARVSFPLIASKVFFALKSAEHRFHATFLFSPGASHTRDELNTLAEFPSATFIVRLLGPLS